MKLKDLKTGTQLKLGFGMIVLLIAVLGAISWYHTNKMTKHTLDIYNHPYTVRNAISELNLDVMAMRLEFRNFLLATDEKSRQTTIMNSDLYQADAERQFEILSERYLGPHTDIENAQKAFIRWVAVRKSNRELGQAGKISEAMSRLEDTGNIGKEREQLLKYIGTIDDFARIKANDFLEGTIELKNSLNRQLGFLVACILALTIYITYLLNRNIRRPVAELARVTQLFKEGNTGVRSSYQSLNEFGLLSLSFNSLADTIESELSLNKKAAKIAGVMLSEDNAHRFSHVLLSALLLNTESQLGAVYLLNDEKTEFELFECIGMNTENVQHFSAKHFEGEFGTALASQKMQHITAIPDDTPFMFSTVSGKFKPREIITIPIVSGDETVAVISLASIKSFSNDSLRLLSNILGMLSARIDGILAYQKVILFSHQLENQNSELEAQKRELSAQANELTEQNVELEMQKKHLDEANQMKTSFLSNMSHELRTPLNSVIALSGVLTRRLEGIIPEEEHSYLDVIERNGKQLLSLINDVLDLSRIEAGYEEIEIRNFNIVELIREIVEMIEPQANLKNIGLHYQADDNLHEISSDYEKCLHIIQNLVANAVKFTEEGGVEITIESKEHTIQIAVTDTGIGIAKEHLPFIFDEFRQADGSNSRKYSGTGLGLAIAKKYTHMLGGNLLVESTRGEGSRFILNLPLRIINDQINEKTYSKPVKHKPKYDIGHLNPNDKTILLVEDTEAVIIQMKEILTMQGYNILVAHNGIEALEQIARKIPDAMILDLMMPEVDGFEVLRHIRSEEKTDHLPVIILTAKYVTKDELSFLKNNGIIQLIHKGDINKEKLLEAIAQMMFPEIAEVVVPDIKPRRITLSGNPVVLVVEDNPDNMLTIKALFDEKFTIIEAEDGRIGIELAYLHQPHLILMDIALPGLNGIEALTALRKEEKLAHIPVIAVSASAMKGDREDLIAFGFDGYISKPIDSVLLDKIISDFLG